MAVIAWVEDDHEKIGALVKLLEREHEIRRYSSWKEVDEKIEEILQTDALILDIILPPIDDGPYRGVDVLTKLRQQGYQKPVIICSHVKNQNVYENLIKLGVQDGNILRKPVRPSKLYEVVTQALD